MTTITSCWTQKEILLIGPMLNLSWIILYAPNQYSLGSLCTRCETSINKLKMGKSAGTDSMQGEHLKYAHSKVTGLLSICHVSTQLSTL